jgi:putative spermidine/putrescine transport system substrate-binding protein/spermidine/putrescine transport system substrate-binding protein
MRSTTRTLTLSVAAVAALGLSACGGSSSSSKNDTTTAAAAPAAKEINLLTWEGYASPKIVSGFEKATGIKVHVSLVGSDDELFAKLKAGGGKQVDIVAVNRTYLPQLSQTNQIVPIDESRIQGLDTVDQTFRSAGNVIGSTRFGLPYVFGAFPITYNPKKIKNPAASYSTILSDKSPYCGHIGWIDSPPDMIQFAAFYLHMPNPYKLTDAEYTKIVDTLKAAKKCVKVITSGYGDAANAFVAGDVWIAPSQGPLLNKNALDAGLTLKDLTPSEGVTYFLDNHAITKAGSAKADAVYKWLNYSLKFDTQKTVTEESFWGGVVQGLSKAVPANVSTLLHLDDSAFYKSLITQQAPQAPDTLKKRFSAWNQVKAG